MVVVLSVVVVDSVVVIVASLVVVASVVVVASLVVLAFVVVASVVGAGVGLPTNWMSYMIPTHRISSHGFRLNFVSLPWCLVYNTTKVDAITSGIPFTTLSRHIRRFYTSHASYFWYKSRDQAVMERLNEPYMPLKCTKKVRLANYRLHQVTDLIYKQQPLFGAKICSDICPQTFSISRSEHFPCAQFQGNCMWALRNT